VPRLLLAIFALVALSGCPWDDPCWSRACGSTCTLCAADDQACQGAESAHACDAGGTCLAVPPGQDPMTHCAPPR
jgi:hypothetical protein